MLKSQEVTGRGGGHRLKAAVGAVVSVVSAAVVTVLGKGFLHPRLGLGPQLLSHWALGAWSRCTVPALPAD